MRGVWRNRKSDRVAAIVINFALVIAVGISGDICLGINAAGMWFLATGLGTLVLGVFRKVLSGNEKFLLMSLLMVLAGFIMMLMG